MTGLTLLFRASLVLFLIIPQSPDLRGLVRSVTVLVDRTPELGPISDPDVNPPPTRGASRAPYHPIASLVDFCPGGPP